MDHEGDLDINELKKVRLEKLGELKSMGIDPFGQRFERSVTAYAIHDQYDVYQDKLVTVGGSIMSKRRHGKAGFANLQDFSGDIQLYFRKDDLGEMNYEIFKKMDIGDILGIEGRVFTTQKGEISLHVTGMVYLSKSLNPLPEKWHGLKDVELRYRQRYVDLIVNPEVKKVFMQRSPIIKEIRRFMD